MDKNRNKLSWTTKIGYGVGDIYGGGAMMIIGFYYLKFLTDVVGMEAALAGWIILFSKAWDAISDPIMGILSDRTRTRFGRRRPYFLAGVILIFISFALLWYPIDSNSDTFKFLAVLGSYLFFSTVVTMVMIPYNALAPELTPDYDERSSLMSVRILFSQFSSLICAVASMEIVKAFPENQVATGYMVMGAVLGLFYALPFIVTFLTTEEKEEFHQDIPKFSFKSNFKDTFKMPTFIHVLFMYISAFVAIDIVMTITVYFISNFLNRPKEVDYILASLLIAQVIALPLFYKYSKITSKQKSYLLSAVVWMVTMFFGWFIVPGQHPSIIYIFAGFIGIGTGGLVLMIFSIFADVPDVDEFYSGERREGIYSGLFTFMRKISSAIGIFFVSQLLHIAGYRAPIKEKVGDGYKLVDQIQSEEFLLILRIIMIAIPILFLIVCIYNSYKFTLKPELHKKIKDYIEKVRYNKELKEQFSEEARLIDRQLRGKKV